MTGDPATERLDFVIRGTVEEWLLKAREFLQEVRERFGEHEEADVLAEVAFYEAFLALYESGTAPLEFSARPSYPVLWNTIEALDRAMEREGERILEWRKRGEIDIASASEAAIAKALTLRRWVETIEPAEGSVDAYTSSLDRTSAT